MADVHAVSRDTRYFFVYSKIWDFSPERYMIHHLPHTIKNRFNNCILFCFAFFSHLFGSSKYKKQKLRIPPIFGVSLCRQIYWWLFLFFENLDSHTLLIKKKKKAWGSYMISKITRLISGRNETRSHSLLLSRIPYSGIQL